jgi:hypothetical protein
VGSVFNQDAGLPDEARDGRPRHDRPWSFAMINSRPWTKTWRMFSHCCSQTHDNAPKGISLDIPHAFREVFGVTDFPSLLMALPSLPPEKCVSCSDDGSPSGDRTPSSQSRAGCETEHRNRLKSFASDGGNSSCSWRTMNEPK